MLVWINLRLDYTSVDCNHKRMFLSKVNSEFIDLMRKRCQLINVDVFLFALRYHGRSLLGIPDPLNPLRDASCGINRQLN